MSLFTRAGDSLLARLAPKVRAGAAFCDLAYCGVVGGRANYKCCCHYADGSVRCGKCMYGPPCNDGNP